MHKNSIGSRKMFSKVITLTTFAVIGIQAGGHGSYEYAASAYGLSDGQGYGHGHGHGYGHSHIGYGGGAALGAIGKLAPVLSSSYTTVTKTVPVAGQVLAKISAPIYDGYAAAYGAPAYGNGLLPPAYLEGVGPAYGLGNGVGYGLGRGLGFGYGPSLGAYGALNLIRK